MPAKNLLLRNQVPHGTPGTKASSRFQVSDLLSERVLAVRIGAAQWEGIAILHINAFSTTFNPTRMMAQEHTRR